MTSLFFNGTLMFAQSSQIPNEVLAWLLEEQDIKVKYESIITKKDSIILSFRLDMDRKQSIIDNLDNNIKEYEEIIKTKDLIIKIHKKQKEEYKKLIRKLKWQKRLAVLGTVGVLILLI